MKRPIVITLLVVALLFVLAGIGAVVFFAVNSSGGNISFNKNQLSAIVEESKTLKVDVKSPVTLKVIDDAGDVTIVGADVKTVQVKVVKTGNALTQSRAEEDLKKIKYEIKQDGNTVTLTYDLPDTINFDINIDTVDFVVTVPNETTVNIGNNMGAVSVSGIKRNVAVKDDFGDVTIKNIEGALSVHSNSGEVSATSIVAASENIDLSSDFGSITLNKANGKDIVLDSNSGAIILSEVRATGSLSSNTDFGDTTFKNGSADTLHIETNSGKVSLSKIKINQDIFIKDDFGDIELEQALALSYDLHTNSGSVSVDGAKGNLKVDTDFGNITINNAQSVTLTAETNSGTVKFSGSLGVGPHSVKSDFGAIDLTLPADSKLNVGLRTDFGDIKSDLPVTVTLNGKHSSEGEEVIGTTNGGGEELTVKANSGNINIHTGK